MKIRKRTSSLYGISVKIIYVAPITTDFNIDTSNQVNEMVVNKFRDFDKENPEGQFHQPEQICGPGHQSKKLPA